MLYYCRSPRRKWLMTRDFCATRQWTLATVRRSFIGEGERMKKRKNNNKKVTFRPVWKRGSKGGEAEVGGIIRSFSENVKKAGVTSNMDTGGRFFTDSFFWFCFSFFFSTRFQENGVKAARTLFELIVSDLTLLLLLVGLSMDVRHPANVPD